MNKETNDFHKEVRSLLFWFVTFIGGAAFLVLDWYLDHHVVKHLIQMFSGG